MVLVVDTLKNASGIGSRICIVSIDLDRTALYPIDA